MKGEAGLHLRKETMQILVKKAQRGDPDAFVKLMELCKDSLYRVAKGFFQSEDDVADAVAQTVLTAYEKLPQLKKPQYFKTWLTKILINTCNQMIRDQKKYVSAEILPEEVYSEEAYTDLEFREMLSSFPEDSRLIVQLYYGEQFTTKEIAKILGLNENTVRSRLRRARERMKEDLSDSL